MLRMARRAPVRTVCEVGFNSGLSAMLFLESATHVRVVSFDLADLPWSARAAEVLAAAYGPCNYPHAATPTHAEAPASRQPLTRGLFEARVADSALHVCARIVADDR